MAPTETEVAWMASLAMVASERTRDHDKMYIMLLYVCYLYRQMRLLDCICKLVFRSIIQVGN